MRPALLPTALPAVLLHAALPCLSWLIVFSVESVEAQQRPVEAALSALEAGRFEQAQRHLDQALGDPDNSRGDLARVYLYRGFLDDALGRNEESRQAFERALALEPGLEAAAMMGSSVRARLETIREDRGGAALDIEAEVEGRQISVRVIGAPAGLVGSVSVVIDGPDEQPAFEQELRPPGPWLVSVPEGLIGDDPRPLRLALRSPEGVEIVEARAQVLPLGPPLEVHIAGTRALSIAARRADRVATVDVWVGDATHPAWSRSLDPPGPWEVEIPEDVYGAEQTVVQAFVRANAPEGESPPPLSLDVPKEESGSIWTNPWFWTAVGVVLAGAAVATVLVVTASSTYEVQPVVVDF